MLSSHWQKIIQRAKQKAGKREKENDFKTKRIYCVRKFELKFPSDFEIPTLYVDIYIKHAVCRPKIWIIKLTEFRKLFDNQYSSIELFFLLLLVVLFWAISNELAGKTSSCQRKQQILFRRCACLCVRICKTKRTKQQKTQLTKYI